MLQDAKIPNKTGCTLEECEQLFDITYKMHHRLQTRKKSKHQIQISVDEDFGDDDPWTGAFKDNASNTVYKLRKIGDLVSHSAFTELIECIFVFFSDYQGS